LGQWYRDALAAFTDRSPEPVFPRWVGWSNVWLGVLLLPATIVIVFKTGPLAWTGLIGFWISAAVFGVWYLVMTWVVLRAVRQEAASTV
jgi:hypothetical protein